MRVLHAGNADHRARHHQARARGIGAGHPQGARGQHLPLHRLHQYRDRHRRRRGGARPEQARRHTGREAHDPRPFTERVRRRRVAAAQGGRAPSARSRAVRVRREAAEHPGRGLRPQPARACAHQGHRVPARCRRAGVHRARSAAAHRDAGGAAGERLQGLGLSAAGDAEGALCRGADRRLHRADARRSGGPRQCGERRFRGAAGGGRCGRGCHQACEPGARELDQQPVHRAACSRKAISTRWRAPPRSWCAATTA